MKFKTMLLGKQMNKNENGFSGKGNWDLYKCFYGEDGNYAEFYINLNHKESIGEIIRKDTDYAPILEQAFEEEMNNLK